MIKELIDNFFKEHSKENECVITYDAEAFKKEKKSLLNMGHKIKMRPKSSTGFICAVITRAV